MNRLSRLALQASFSVLLFAAVFLLVAQSSLRRAAGQSCGSLAVRSAASYAPELAPESIAVGFGVNLATREEAATTQPLPTQLAGTTVKVKDGAGVERQAPLFYVSSGQVNFLIPAGTANGAATITVTSGDGKCSTGTAPIAKATPGLFTANASGQGIPAAVALRFKPDGTQSYEPVSPLSLGPENEQIYLILFGTGIRGRNALTDVTMQIGGEKADVLFAEAHKDFTGLDQINVGPVSRRLIGRCKVNLALTINSFGSANLTEIEMAGASGTSSSQISFNPPSILAGDILTINGAGFSSRPADNLVRIGCAEARVDSASPTQLNARVPFGAETAPVSVRTSGGEGRGANPLMLRTSISGIVEDTARQPLLGVTVRVPGQQQPVRTNADGSFVFPDPLPPGVTGNSGLIVEIDGSTVTAPRPYPKVSLKRPTLAGRDNQFPGPIALQQIIGPGIPVGSSPTLSADAPSFNLKTAIALAPNQTGRSGNIVFEIQPGTTARFPNGATSGILNLTVVENQRTPVKLPPDIFSSAIVQITEFDVRLNPGGKLTFPNTNGLDAGTQATLYRLDQRRESPTLGEFINSGIATVSADGMRIETAPDAITDTTIYFVAAKRFTTTVTGRVVDSDGRMTPVRQARVRCRGQEAFTDGNGGFTISNVLVNQGDELSVEASFQRSILTGRVDRIQRDKISAVVNGVTEVIGDLTLPSETSNRPPVILIPTDLTLAEGETRSIDFIAGDPDPGQRVVSVVIAPPLPFVTLRQIGNDVWNLRITPGSNDAGTYNPILTATDNLGGVLSLQIRLRVNRPPFANPQTVTLDEDTSKLIQLTGNDPGGLPLNFIIDNQPAMGRLSGPPPNLTYTPKLDYNGSDAFTFHVNNGFSNSAPATVSIFVNPVNDAPKLIISGSQIGDTGKVLVLIVTATDVETNQELKFTVENPPPGAGFIQIGPNTFRFSWTPSDRDVGGHTVIFMVSDNGIPQGKDSKEVTLTITPRWEQTRGMLGGQIFAFQGNDQLLFAGGSGGVYRSSNQGQSWLIRSKDLTNTRVLTLAQIGPYLFAGIDSGGVYRSINQGDNWEPVQQGLPPNATVAALAVIGTNLFAGTNTGVFHSANQGLTWTAINDGLMNTKVNALVVSGTDLFAGIDVGVFKLPGGTQRWLPFSEGLPNAPVLSLTVSGSMLYAGLDRSGVYRSLTQSPNWQDFNSPGLLIRTVTALNVSGANLLAGTFGGVFLTSIQQSPNWAARNQGLTNQIVNAFGVFGGTLLAGTYGGVFGSADQGQSWGAANSGITGVIVNALASIGGNLFAGTSSDGVYRWTDQSQSWEPVNNELQSRTVLALAVINTTLFAGADNGVYLSPNQGVNWLPRNTGLPDARYITALAASGATLYAGISPGGGVYRSDNLGQSWTSANNGLADRDVRALVVWDNAVFAGTECGGIFRSTDRGLSWAPVNNGIGFCENLPGCQNNRGRRVHALNSNRWGLFAGTCDGVYRWNDAEQSWRHINVGLPPQAFVNTILEKDNMLFVGLFGGIYFSIDQGANWVRADTDLTHINVFSLAQSGSRVFAGTIGGGVYISR